MSGDKKMMEVKILDGESWWGGACHDGIHMPFGNKTFMRSLDPNMTENQAMPFLVSNKGRYIWCDEPIAFHIQKEYVKITSRFGEIQLFEGFKSLRDAYKSACKRHFSSMGKVPEKELFTVPQYNTWIELMYDQRQEYILKYAQDIINQGLPPGILMIDDNWQEDYGVWEFHRERFDDPKGMIEKLHSMGFKVMLWTCPFISADSMTYRMLRDEDLLLKESSGEVAIRKWWNGYSALLDMTHPKACKWYRDRLQNLIDTYGVDGFKFDAGDPMFYKEGDVSYVMSTPQEHCHSYAQFGLDFSLNEYRTAWKNAGWPLAQRLCDKEHAWGENGLGSLIPNGLAQGILGYAFTCPDMIGGGQYTNFLPGKLKLDQELFVRYAQCSALFPMMQFSAAPWRVLDEEHNRYCIEAAHLHVIFGKYIWLLAKDSAFSGEPIMRYMAYSFGTDYDEITDQFMLGDDVLVAPIIVKGLRKRIVQIPEGTWISDEQELIEGPCIIEANVPLSRLPFYIRKSPEIMHLGTWGECLKIVENR